MFKPGQIWDRTFPNERSQIGIILSDLSHTKYQIFVLSGWNAGCYVDWFPDMMAVDLRDGKLVQLA